MIKDYHFLARCVFELKKIIVGSKILSVFTQDKDKLFFHLPANEFPDRHLEISLNSQLPYLLLRNNFHKAKKNTFNFFDNSLPAEITDLRISKNDRIIDIATNSDDYIVLIRGGGSNVIRYNLTTLESFKKIKNEEMLKNEISKQEFINNPGEIIFESQIDFSSYSTVRNIAPYISKKLYFEIISRTSKDDYFNNYKKCISEILNSRIAYGVDLNSNFIFQPITFHRPEDNSFNESDNYNNAVSEYIITRFKYDRFTGIRKLVQNHIERELKGLTNKLNNLNKRVSDGSRDEEYYSKANLLLVNLRDISPNSELVHLKDITTGKETKIILDKKLNAQENANRYFKKAKDEKKNFDASKKILEATKIKYETYISFKEQINKTISIDELKYIQNQLSIKDVKQREKLDTEKINCHKFILDGKFHVVVGRDSKSNDMLTVKLAKQNDYWFHARGMPGSHVILRVDNPKEAIPKNILNCAASIAAYYSKAKTAKVAPVAYTLRKFVRKNKNMNLGQVIMTKEKVLLVKPEIPKNAQFIEE
jgi:predicted ribosome quality control (RQC) complex YloA/Tae2 family protein